MKNTNNKINKERLLVTGGTGMVGRAIVRVLPSNFSAYAVGSSDFDLTNPSKTRKMFREFKPTKVIHLAAKVGGVKANTDFVADFFNENILINTNVLLAAHKFGVQNLVSLLSTCVYPDRQWVKFPLTVDQLHKGPPHNSNYGYAYAKRMIEVQSRAFRQQYNRNYTTAIPNNIYGPHDQFDLEKGHVVPVVIRKIYEAKKNNTIPIFWGDGQALREFTYVDDIAHCLLKIIGIPDGEVYKNVLPCNIGTNIEVSIEDLVNVVADELNYGGKLKWDTSKPAGQNRKPSQSNCINHKYKHLRDGIRETCEWFVANYPNIRGVQQ